MTRALEEDRDDPFFPFWSSLALEFLARAAVANVHPSLLAAPDPTMQNVLYALGKPGPKKGAKSITASTAFDLCRQLVPNFGPEEVALCESLANRRNEELHSGGVPFEEFATGDWVARFYSTCNKLVIFLNRSLVDFLGDKETQTAKKIMVAAEEAVVEKVKRSISAHRTTFGEKDEKTRDGLLAASKEMSSKMSQQGGHRVVCPACGAQSWVTGEPITSQGGKYEDHFVVERTAMLPTKMECIACGLVLGSHAELDVAGVGGQYTQTSYFNPVDYYSEHMGPDWDYSNE
jgi:hypothetical protein